MTRANLSRYLRRFSSTCECSQVAPASLEIPPGETRRVTLTLDLRSLSREDAAKAITDFAVNLTPILATDPEQQGPTWRLTARVRRPLLGPPRRIDLGWHSERAQPFEPVSVKVEVAPGIDELRAFGKGMFVSLARDKKDANRYTLSVSPVGRLQVGEVSGTVMLTPYRQGKALPTHTISASGMVVDDIELSPSGLLLGAQPIGTTRTETVTLRSRTGAKFEVVRVESPGPDTRVEQPTGADVGRRLLVHQKITANGQYAGDIRLTLRDPDGSTRMMDLRVAYFGMDSASE